MFIGHLFSELEYGLGSIRIIRTYLKVHKTQGMLSLGYFKSLQKIQGDELIDNM